jgi:hypothetical protein
MPAGLLYGVNATFVLFWRDAVWPKPIMKIGPLPDAMKPDFQCVRTGTGVSWRSSWSGASGPWC